MLVGAPVPRRPATSRMVFYNRPAFMAFGFAGAVLLASTGVDLL